MSNRSVSSRSAAALKGWETRRAKAASQMVAQPVQQQQAKARAPKPARGERRYVTVRDTETGEIHRVLTSVASVGVAVVIFSPSNRHRQGALSGMLITHDDTRKAWVFNDEAEARHMLSNNRAPGERVIRAELVADPAPLVAQPVQQAQCNAAPVAAPGAPSEAIETAPRFDVQSALYAYVRIAQGAAPQTVIRSAASIRAKLDPALVARYRHARRNMSVYDFSGIVLVSKAELALSRARSDTKERYPAEFTGWQTGRGTEARFIEQPGECGLRFVGYADEIVNLRHTGHFTDREICDQSLRGVVYQMASRKGELLFVSGYEDANIEGACSFDFSHICRETIPSDPLECETVKDFAHDAAYYAESMAERAAEEECDYQEAWRAGLDYVEAGTEYREARKLYLGTISAMRRSEYSAFRGDVTAKFLAEREKLVSKRHKLFSDFGNTDAFREHLPE